MVHAVLVFMSFANSRRDSYVIERDRCVLNSLRIGPYLAPGKAERQVRK
jgi:hypothetical protein